MDPRKFLNSLFEIAVAKAQPRQCVPPFLSKLDFAERTVVFGAGKAPCGYGTGSRAAHIR
ncbi:MAG: hypothetical protein CM1200mP28_02320 [Deltaproteobacteria bacterium]|nr:MAG: hypothetical protein CM1200mP28_02320 [Deltaproteobacteria bacterium]